MVEREGATGAHLLVVLHGGGRSDGARAVGASGARGCRRGTMGRGAQAPAGFGRLWWLDMRENKEKVEAARGLGAGGSRGGLETAAAAGRGRIPRK